MATRRALITSGGGAKGAFSVGALKTLNKHGLADFDIISGTSTGSLIAALAAVRRFDILEREYKAGSNRDFLSQTNLVRSIAKDKPYLYDTLPLESKIDEYITSDVFDQINDENKTVCLTSISLQTGRRSVFSNKKLTKPSHGLYDPYHIKDYETFKKAILASTNQAAFLPPISISPEELGAVQQFVDGGNRDVLPTQPAVDLKPTEVFALSNNPRKLNVVNKEYTSVFDVLFRAISIFIQDVRANDYAVLASCKDAEIFEIEPKSELDRNNPTGLNFNRVDMAGWMRLGELTAKRILQEKGKI